MTKTAMSDETAGNKEFESRQLLVEVLTASDCGRCQKAKALVKNVVDEFKKDAILYRDVNVVEEIDYAVKLGVMRTPAIAINGKLAFPVLPSMIKLRQAICECLKAVDGKYLADK